MTEDETWLYQYDPEDKQQSKQLLLKGSSGPIKGKFEIYIVKIMATILWDSKGIFLIDYLEEQRTINAICYEQVLEKLHQANNKKWRGKHHDRVLLHYDNASTNSSLLVRDKLTDLRWEFLCHTPYSPDLVPSDSFLNSKRQQRPWSIQMMLNSTDKV